MPTRRTKQFAPRRGSALKRQKMGRGAENDLEDAGPNSSTPTSPKDCGPGLATASMSNHDAQPDIASMGDNSLKDDSSRDDSSKDDCSKADFSMDDGANGNDGASGDDSAGGDDSANGDDSASKEKDVSKMLTDRVEELQQQLRNAYSSQKMLRSLTSPLDSYNVDCAIGVWHDLSGLIQAAGYHVPAGLSWDNLKAETQEKLSSWSPHAKQMFESHGRDRSPLFAAWIWHILVDNLFSPTGASKLSGSNELWASYRKLQVAFHGECHNSYIMAMD